jgi:hypothetical protein
MAPSAHDLRARIRAALLLDLPVFWFPPRQFAIRLSGARARKEARVCKKNMRRKEGSRFFLGTRKIAQFRRHAKMGLTVLQFGGLAACASSSANIYASEKAASSGSLLQRNFVSACKIIQRATSVYVCMCASCLRLNKTSF